MAGTAAVHEVDPVNLVERILAVTGWTQTRLVTEIRRMARLLHGSDPVGLHVVTVNRWKRGRQVPSGYYQQLLRCLYAESCGSPVVGGTEQGHALRVPRTDEVDEMKRRQFLAQTAALAGGAMLDLEQMTAALTRGVGIDTRLADDLTASVEHSARRWYRERPEALLPVVREQLEAVSELRARSRNSTVTTRLVKLTGDVAALTGWIMYLVGNREAADAYYVFASALAIERNDQDGGAFVLVARSFLRSALFQPDGTRDGRTVALLDEATSRLGHSSPPFLRVFAHARRAEELSDVGVPEAAAAAWADLDRADGILAGAHAGDTGFFSYWNAARLMGCRGTCAMIQKRHGEAISLLSEVLVDTPVELRLERSILLSDLGAAFAMKGEVEQGSRLLARSLSQGGEWDVNRVGRIVAMRNKHLARWSDVPAVQDLDEALRAAQQAPTGLAG